MSVPATKRRTTPRDTGAFSTMRRTVWLRDAVSRAARSTSVTLVLPSPRSGDEIGRRDEVQPREGQGLGQVGLPLGTALGSARVDLDDDRALERVAGGGLGEPRGPPRRA